MNIARDLNDEQFYTYIHEIENNNKLLKEEKHKLNLEYIDLQYKNKELEFTLNKDIKYIQLKCKEGQLLENERELNKKNNKIRELEENISSYENFIKNNEHNKDQNYSNIIEQLKMQLNDSNEKCKFLEKRLNENIKYNSQLKGKDSINYCNECPKLRDELTDLKKQLNDIEIVFNDTLNQTQLPLNGGSSSKCNYKEILLNDNYPEIIESSSSNIASSSKLTNQSENMVSSSKSTNKSENIALSSDLTNQSENNSSKLTHQTENMASLSKSIRFCNEYLKTGRCPYEKTCYYKHKTRKWINDTQPMCEFFKSSKCCYGDQCRFSHKL